MPRNHAPFDTAKFITASQVGGIERYAFDDGEARGLRALLVNTGGGLRYRILPDRGLDIDQAFFNQHSLAFLSHKGVTPPTRALDHGLDWLKGFPVGLLTSCGPFNIGGPGQDEDGEFGLHGPHSNTASSIESVIQPDPHAGRMEMSVTARVRYGAFYGPNVELRRTISSTLGENSVRVADEFFNAGNHPAPHAWLLHVNFGYPLVDEGAEFCYDEQKIEPLPGDAYAAKRFADKGNYKRIPGPLAEQSGPTSWVGYLYPKAGKDGAATVAIVNAKLGLGAAIHYNTKEFPRCANWQHFGQYEYVAALEPSTGSVEGRDKDRPRGLVRTLEPRQRITYQYSIDLVSDKEGLAALRALNKKG